MEKYREIIDLVLSLEDDFVKFYDKKNNSAGVRVRKGLQEVKCIAHEIRKDIQSVKRKRKKLS